MESRKVVFAKPFEVVIETEACDASALAADEMLLKKHYTAISAGTELACLSGSESYFVMPRTPGYTAVSEVIAKGSGVTKFETGDLIFHYGRHMEYQVVKSNDFLIKLNSAKNEEYIPFVRMATVAYTAIRVSSIELGDYVAVTGQGLVGNFAAQLAKLSGARVIAVDVSDNRLEISKQCGVYATVNPAKTDDLKKAIMDLTEGQGVSTLIDATGVPKVAADGFDLVAQHGEIILLGTPRGEYNGNIANVFTRSHVAKFDVTVKGAHEWKFPIKEIKAEMYAVKHSIERNTKIALGQFERGELVFKPLLSLMAGVADAPDAYRKLREDKDGYMGVIIDWKK